VDGNNIIVGYTQLSLSWVDARERLVEVLVLSPLAVAPTHQCQGIGSSLLTAARQEAERLKAPLLFLEGDPRYYSRHGWRPAGELGFCPPSARIPSLAFQVVTLPGYDPTTMRGALVYNDTFWSHDCVGLRGARLDQWSRAGRTSPRIRRDRRLRSHALPLRVGVAQRRRVTLRHRVSGDHVTFAQRSTPQRPEPAGARTEKLTAHSRAS
jgi:putative acetyltransferase